MNKTQHGYTPLYIACAWGVNAANIELLLKHGADPVRLTAPYFLHDIYFIILHTRMQNLRCAGVSPLHMCCTRGSVAGVRYLLEAQPLPANPNLTRSVRPLCSACAMSAVALF